MTRHAESATEKQSDPADADSLLHHESDLPQLREIRSGPFDPGAFQTVRHRAEHDPAGI